LTIATSQYSSEAIAYSEGKCEKIETGSMLITQDKIAKWPTSFEVLGLFQFFPNAKDPVGFVV